MKSEEPRFGVRLTQKEREERGLELVDMTTKLERTDVAVTPDQETANAMAKREQKHAHAMQWVWVVILVGVAVMFIAPLAARLWP